MPASADQPNANAHLPVLDLETIEPGYYYASYGHYAPHLVCVLWQLKPHLRGKGIGAFMPGGERRDPASYQDLCIILPGLIDRQKVSAGRWRFHVRIPSAEKLLDLD